VSKEWREKADTEINTQQLFKSPADYKGKIVIIGGVIIKSTNTKEGTYIEVVQMPLDSTGKPEKRDVSYGRFLILYEGYLDTAIYSRGREVTVAGEVIGEKTRPLGEIQYSYLLVKSKELYLFEEMRYKSLPVWFGIDVWRRM
jgi:outer membrane lipoprotein